ncbi:MAG: hypothetical protein AB7K36_23890, partial [Chloroflexota bacterium]
MPSAYAAVEGSDAAGRLYQNGNNNDNNDNNGNNNDNNGNNNNNDNNDNGNSNNNNNDNNNNDNGGDDNDNAECYLNLNDNEAVPCDFEENDNTYIPPAAAPSEPAPSNGPVAASRRCFDVQEIGNVQLTLSGGTITVQVVPGVGFPSVTWIELDDVEDMSSVPALPAGTTLLDSLMWRINAGDGCDGAGIGTLPNDVNLGIPYSVPADKSKLQIMRVSGGQWVEVNTVPDPDPNNPYISSTIRETGVYAVVQMP